jgi:hypothetical protein
MIDFYSFRPEDAKLQVIRKELYHSESPGFYVFKKFIPEHFVSHMRTFWVNEAPISRLHSTLQEVVKPRLFYYGCPNYLYKTPYGHAYYNYFWNSPIDEVSHSVSFVVQQLRNIVESKNNYLDFFPSEGNSCSYRVVFTRNGERIVAPHQDWTTPPYFRPEKLQATLILSKKGQDYEGVGMKMLSNDKKTEYIFDGNLPVEPGDLVLWRYNNMHSIENVITREDQIGFLRMIFPPETIHPKPTDMVLGEIKASELMNNLKQRIKKRIKL